MWVWVLVCHVHVTPESADMRFLFESNNLKMVWFIETLFHGHQSCATGTDHCNAFLGLDA
jgi:hypothetical protein